MTLKEKAKVQSLQEHIDQSQIFVEEFKQDLSDLRVSLETKKKTDGQAFTTFQEDLNRVTNSLTFGVSSLRDEMKGKVELSDLITTNGNVKDMRKRLEVELPDMLRSLGEKADDNKLSALRLEMYELMGNVSNIKEINTTMLGARAYCLSCQQPIRTPGPESDSKQLFFNIIYYYFKSH